MDSIKQFRTLCIKKWNEMSPKKKAIAAGVVVVIIISVIAGGK